MSSSFIGRLWNSSQFYDEGMLKIFLFNEFHFNESHSNKIRADRTLSTTVCAIT